MNEITMVAPATLLPHPKNAAVYGSTDNDSINDILGSLTDAETLETIIISKTTNHIVSGHRRVRAAIELGFTSVPVEYRAYASEDEELEALLLFNLQRSKTVEMRVREGIQWEEIESKKARERQLAGLKQFATVVQNSTQRSEDSKTRDIIAARIKLSGFSYDHAKKIVELADALAEQGKATEAYGLLYILNNQSIDAAHKLVREKNNDIRNRALRIIAQQGKTVEDAERDAVAAIRKEQEAAQKAARERQQAEAQARAAKEAQERAIREANERERLAQEAQERAKRQQDERSRQEAARLLREAQEAEERAWQEHEAAEKARQEAERCAQRETEAKQRAEAAKTKAPKPAKKLDTKRVLETARVDHVAHHAQAIELVVEDTKTTRTVQQGQWWKLGRHRLYCGDTSQPAFYDALPDVAFAFADPPYGVTDEEWDKEFYWEHDWLIQKAQIVAVTPGQPAIFAFAQRTTMPYRTSMASWVKNGMTLSQVGYQNWIYIALFAKQDVSIFRQCQDIIPVTIKTSENTETMHKGRKPGEFMVRLIELFSEPEQIVIDPFAGSGQTLLACETTNRVCWTGELNPTFCEEIIARWETVTGKIAEVIS